MKVFVTGATGFVGSAVVDELLANGHEVLGLARSDRGAAEIEKRGARVHRGDLERPETLRAGAEAADAVIHTGFVHDFTRFAEVCAVDRVAIETLGSVVEGTGKPLVVTTGLAALDAAGRLATEEDQAFPPSLDYPRASDAAAQALLERGIAAELMRLPPSVHGAGDHGFVPMLIGIARRKGCSAYIGEGANRWPAVHRDDAARLYRLVVENGASGGTWHANAEEGVAFRKIAEAIGEGLGLPCVSLSDHEAEAHFEGFYGFATMDQAASSEITRSRLGWTPTGPDLISDIGRSGYFG
ncbi:SDR family oxidoreductase [Aureimonas mangrovi]|uniref:SDR family oxidoreductase n=1 Tax=Aureimonas mangrovi TaxID=2758041 RepID=UPI00163DD1F8|nr:SDR family oxidoreductase [Aureimonas mangrovi]